MARIKEYPSIESFDGNADALAIEQTDGASNRTRKVSPAQLKQYMEAGDFEATGEVKDGHGNILANMAKIIKASSSDTKVFTFPKNVWANNGLSGQNHTALFCGGYAGRISAGFIGLNNNNVTAIKLGENPVTVTINGDNVVITFANTIYTDLYLILFN